MKNKLNILVLFFNTFAVMYLLIHQEKYKYTCTSKWSTLGPVQRYNADNRTTSWKLQILHSGMILTNTGDLSTM